MNGSDVMAGDLHRLVYYSRNAIERPPGELAAEVERILQASRRNNARAGITGALMVNRGCFAQVLEGPRAAIERLFEHIQRDPRHTGVMPLQFIPIAERGFPAWSMAFVGRSAEDADLLDGLAARSGFDPARLAGEHLFKRLRSLVLEEEGVPG